MRARVGESLAGRKLTLVSSSDARPALESSQIATSLLQQGADLSAPRQTARARELRKEQTPAEEALWQLLRNRRLLRLKFRRQVPIGPYIADFYCPRYRLVVELDGPIHEERRQAAHDEDRAVYLSILGLTILRFTNQRVFEEPESVLREIHETVG